MVPEAENTEEATLEAEVSERELASRSLRSAPWLSGVYVCFSCVVTSSQAIDVPSPKLCRGSRLSSPHTARVADLLASSQ